MKNEENWEHFLSFEEEHKLPKDFFKKIYSEDDWSFVIKIHSLLESITSSLILFHFKEPSISNIISRLEMSNPKTGKIAFLRAMQLVDTCYLQYISSLSQLRNNLVHKIENISFTFEDWISKMDKNQFKQNAINFSPDESMGFRMHKKSKLRKEQGKRYFESPEPDMKRLYERFKDHTKDHIWYELHYLLVHISGARVESDFWNEMRYSKLLHDYEKEDEDTN